MMAPVLVMLAVPLKLVLPPVNRIEMAAAWTRKFGTAQPRAANAVGLVAVVTRAGVHGATSEIGNSE